ncbi:hypothetical protein [Saccharopolyspora sp. CA-218241]|uniref:hypothetical protein n=1 Tax=Saccharopolyspora sp. CA-218241 TaxID=3240027 RepID=UPI003D978B9A
MNVAAEQVEWFQIKPGLVVESLRVAHCAAATSDDEAIQSWCRLKFHPTDVEETTGPSSAPELGKARPCAPCNVCLLRLMAATDAGKDRDEPAQSSEDSRLAVVLRKAQWLLDDAAYYLPQGRCGSEERELLAKTLDQLAVLVREGSTNVAVER